MIAVAVIGIILAYAVIGGVVYEALKHFDAMDGAEEVVAAFWPLFTVIGSVVGAAYLFAIAGQYVGARVVTAA